MCETECGRNISSGILHLKTDLVSGGNKFSGLLCDQLSCRINRVAGGLLGLAVNQHNRSAVELFSENDQSFARDHCARYHKRMGWSGNPCHEGVFPELAKIW